MEQTDRFVLSRCPRTASSWSVEALRSACQNVRPVDRGPSAMGHPTLSDVLFSDQPRVREQVAGKYAYVQVRQPVRWLRSVYWWSKKWEGRRTFEEATRIMMPAPTETFDAFAYEYLDRYAGTISRVFDAYTKHADFVGTAELCRLHLAEALYDAGEERDLSAILNHPKVNVSHEDHEGAPPPLWIQNALAVTDEKALEIWKKASDGWLEFGRRADGGYDGMEVELSLE